MANHVYKMVELVGSSPTGTDDAIRNAIAQAAATLRHLDWFEVVETRGQIADGRLPDRAVAPASPARSARRREPARSFVGATGASHRCARPSSQGARAARSRRRQCVHRGNDPPSPVPRSTP